MGVDAGWRLAPVLVGVGVVSALLLVLALLLVRVLAPVLVLGLLVLMVLVQLLVRGGGGGFSSVHDATSSLSSSQQASK